MKKILLVVFAVFISILALAQNPEDLRNAAIRLASRGYSY